MVIVRRAFWRMKVYKVLSPLRLAAVTSICSPMVLYKEVSVSSSSTHRRSYNPFKASRPAHYVVLRDENFNGFPNV